MKVTQEQALFEIPFGSHLYGTNGPTSDLDFKVVCLPSLVDLLKNTQQKNRKVLPEGKKDGEKMNKDEAEYEYIPLQVFLNDFFNGQTYALEIAFAVMQGKFTAMDTRDTHELEEWINMLVGLYLTSNVKKMVGYAVSQSQNYGLKTERYTVLRDAIAIVQSYLDTQATNAGFLASVQVAQNVRLDAAPSLVERLVELKHVKCCEILNGSGGTAMAPAIEICGKQFPLTTAVSTVLRSITSLLNTYGDRVKKYDGEGVDWKALSHAIRITEQVLELSKTGFITFPRPNAAYLKSVKDGEVSIEEATAVLTDRFNELDVAVTNSILPEKTEQLEVNFEQFKESMLLTFYHKDMMQITREEFIERAVRLLERSL